jgi:hypothetical protein
MYLDLVMSALNAACAINSICQHTWGLAVFNGAVSVWCLYWWWNARKTYLNAQESSSN